MKNLGLFIIMIPFSLFFSALGIYVGIPFLIFYYDKIYRKYKR